MALTELRYFSNVLEKQSTAMVILPDRQVKPPYSVLYLLHGLSDDHSIWLRRTSIERYVEGTGLIVVMPDGGRSFYVDAHQGARYGEALGHELPAIIDHYFPTKAERSGRAIAGLSMGGYGALHLALSHPGDFAAAVSHSGALTFGHEGWRGDQPEFQRIIGPEVTGGPCDLFKLVEKTRAGMLPALRIDCGTEDFLIEQNREFHRHLETLKVAHEYQEHPGAHTWEYWDRHVQDTLRFVKPLVGLG